MTRLLFLTFFFIHLLTFGQTDWKGNTTPTYGELIAYLQKLDRENQEISLYNMGASDHGQPIYLCVVNGDKDSTKTFLKARNSTTILINNAIHPGEPDGVNACLIWIENWIKDGKPTRSKNGKSLPLIAIIPAYNVGGMHNRSSTSRANQNGPEEYGFRGSAKNLDLNRDFTKMDAENTKTFVKIYQALDPDIFIDNHVSNGADYPYTLTYISSNKARLSPTMKELTYASCIPFIEETCLGGFELFPYVELKGKTPEEGIIAFNDLPRYAMGYASLFNSLSFTVETHMLKAFPQRVQATLQFMESTIAYAIENASTIEKARKEAKKWDEEQTFFKYNFKLQNNSTDSIFFKGYTPIYPIHPITGLAQLEYDQNQPFQKYIPYFNQYYPSDSIKIPTYYIIGGQEKRILELLKINGVHYQVIDSFYHQKVTCTYVKDFKAPARPYEGHFKLSSIELEQIDKSVQIKPGDVLIPSKQERAMYIHSVLQAGAEDSYLTWNFFDSYLQQKEYFSSYVFKESLGKILEANPELKKQYEQKKSEDPTFANSEWDQLFFIYQRSPYFEQTFMQLPIYMMY